MSDGARYAEVLTEVAKKSKRDILVTPEGAGLVVVPGQHGRPTVVAVDRSTGRPVRWQVIQPDSVAWRPIARISYRLTDDGKVIPRSFGPVGLSLSGGSGVIFTDLNSYETWARRISSSPTSRSDLVTVIFRYSYDENLPFAINGFDGNEVKLDGVASRKC